MVRAGFEAADLEFQDRDQQLAALAREMARNEYGRYLLGLLEAR